MYFQNVTTDAKCNNIENQQNVTALIPKQIMRKEIRPLALSSKPLKLLKQLMVRFMVITFWELLYLLYDVLLLCAQLSRFVCSCHIL